ncbi:MAG: CDP-diacylglycerol--glycerol-3-phosphate 3-phosphatidyltransferase [Woeseiaceae bacterium]
MNLNIPNILTLFRIGLMPVLVIVFYYPAFEDQHVVLASLFFFIGITDLLDGYLARKLGQQSAFGAFLDPVADKLSVSIALILIVSAHPGPFIAIPVAIIIGRELTISALREWMASIGANIKVKVSYIGKVKTAGQLWAIGFMLYEQPIGWFSPLQFGYLLLYISSALTLWSMVTYLIAAWPSLKKEG